MYFRARFYDPDTGEFVSRDPLEYVDGMSQYRGYFAISYVDPYGYYELKYENHAGSPDNFTKCGSAHWNIDFHIIAGAKDPKGGLAGILVQYVKMESDVTKCPPCQKEEKIKKDSKEYKAKIPHGPFWELWETDKNGKDKNSKPLDFPSDSFKTPDWGKNTRGTTTVIGKAVFYSGKAKPGVFGPSPKGHPSGDLPFTPNDPKLGAGDASLNRKFVVKWDCCDEDESKHSQSFDWSPKDKEINYVPPKNGGGKGPQK